MDYRYVVRISDDPKREELKWAMNFTVRMRDNYTCQDCHRPGKDVAHIESRTANPSREFDPDNARVLCRSCHMTADHRNDHRPSGRPVGYKLGPESRAKISEGGRLAKASLEWRRGASERAKEQWDRIGRKAAGPCPQCGKALTRWQVTHDYKFCSRDCTYEYRRGKPKASWK